MQTQVTQSAISTPRAAVMGSVSVSIHGMTGYDSSIALTFGSLNAGGLSASFHGTTEEMRAFAAEIIRHADITDAAQARVEQAAA